MQVLGQRGFDTDRLVGPRVGESERFGVEAETGEEGAFLVAVAGFVVGLDLRKIEGFGISVERIDQQGQVDQGEVDANLMLAAGQRSAADERNSLKTLDDLPFGLGRPSFLFADDHFRGHTRVRRDRSDDQAAVFFRPAANQGKVLFLHLAFLELLGKTPLSLGGLGQEQDSAGPRVKAVDEKEFLSNTEGMSNGLAQGMSALTAGDGKQAGGFIDREKMVVLQENCQALCVFHVECLRTFPLYRFRPGGTEAGKIPAGECPLQIIAAARSIKI